MTAGDHVTAAWVDGEPVPAADVEAELDRLRGGPLADRLPPADTADGRQLRRWVAQRVVLTRLLENEAAARGLTTPSTVRVDAAVVGAAAADVLATSAAARAVLATFDTRPTDAEVREHYAAHPDRYARGERWLARQAYAPTPDALVLGPAAELDPATLVPELRARPAGPVHTGLGWHRLEVDAVLPAGPVPYGQVRPEIEAELTARATQLAFARWLDRAAADRIRLASGFEHPADPRQPDASHRH
ncbi:MAG TPA: peptidylprolyl isomerase [Mycobacteriales bacterium]